MSLLQWAYIIIHLLCFIVLVALICVMVHIIIKGIKILTNKTSKEVKKDIEKYLDR